MKTYKLIGGLAMLLIAITAKAQDTLVITEKSSTSLTAIFDGNPLTVTTVGPDNWTFSLPVDTGSIGVGWTEPENGDLANELNLPGTSPQTVTVHSDVSGGRFGLPNGFTLGVGEADAGALNITFNDVADTSKGSVPDAASSALLLMISAAGLACARRGQAAFCRIFRVV